MPCIVDNVMAHVQNIIGIEELRSRMSGFFTAHGFAYAGKGNFESLTEGRVRRVILKRHMPLSFFSNVRMDFEVEVYEASGALLTRRRLDGERIVGFRRDNWKEWKSNQPSIWEIRNAAEIAKIIEVMERFFLQFGLVFLNADFKVYLKHDVR